MARETPARDAEKVFEADDINPEIVAAIDEVQGRRTLEIEATAAKSDRQRNRTIRLAAIGVAAALVIVGAVLLN